MALIAVLLSLWLNRFADKIDPWRRDSALDALCDGLAKRLPRSVWNGPAGVLLVLVPGGLLAVLVTELLGDWFLGLGWFALSVLALLFAHGTVRVDETLEKFLAKWDEGNSEASWYYVEHILPPGWPLPDTPDELADITVKAMLAQTHQRIFAPIFYLVIAGPVGPVLYRLASMMMDHGRRRATFSGLTQAAESLVWLLNWIPARLLGFAFCMAGHFTLAMARWRALGWSGGDNNPDFLQATALGAMDIDKVDASDAASALRETRALITRSLIFWVAGVAVLTLMNWLI